MQILVDLHGIVVNLHNILQIIVDLHGIDVNLQVISSLDHYNPIHIHWYTFILLIVTTQVFPIIKNPNLNFFLTKPMHGECAY